MYQAAMFVHIQILQFRNPMEPPETKITHFKVFQRLSRIDVISQA